MYPTNRQADEMIRKKILVVDDEPDILMLMEDILDEFNIVSTTDPLRALEIYKNEEIALVISDFKMPEMNGLELYAELRKLALDRSSPLFYMITSGFGDNTLEEKAYRVGVTAFFKKPIDDLRLRASVKKVLFAGGGHNDAPSRLISRFGISLFKPCRFALNWRGREIWGA